MLQLGLPFADAWNIWWEDYGNTPEGFARASAVVDAAARDAGLDPAAIERSACVLVAFDPASGERRIPDGMRALDGSPPTLAEALRAFAEVGADEVIVVAVPIDASSIRALGEGVALLDVG
jgi:alkanesulfonate monooxygenase SsuD/methylene tetrahydromethanopterin reductase-like flavin-dependent oxidoreductase (luciferase family)